MYIKPIVKTYLHLEIRWVMENACFDISGCGRQHSGPQRGLCPNWWIHGEGDVQMWVGQGPWKGEINLNYPGRPHLVTSPSKWREKWQQKDREVLHAGFEDVVRAASRYWKKQEFKQKFLLALWRSPKRGAVLLTPWWQPGPTWVGLL